MDIPALHMQGQRDQGRNELALGCNLSTHFFGRVPRTGNDCLGNPDGEDTSYIIPLGWPISYFGAVGDSREPRCLIREAGATLERAAPWFFLCRIYDSRPLVCRLFNCDEKDGADEEP